MEEQEGDVPSDIQRKKRFDFFFFMFEWLETDVFGCRVCLNDMRCKCFKSSDKIH